VYDADSSSIEANDCVSVANLDSVANFCFVAEAGADVESELDSQLRSGLKCRFEYVDLVLVFFIYISVFITEIYKVANVADAPSDQNSDEPRRYCPEGGVNWVRAIGFINRN